MVGSVGPRTACVCVCVCCVAKRDTHVCLCASHNHILVTMGGYNELTIIILYS